MLVGYMRVSTDGDRQVLDLQRDALLSAGVEERHLYADQASGSRGDRAGLAKALELIRPGDCLVVWKLDRLGRSLPHLLSTVNDLRACGIAFRSLTEQMDTTTPQGEFLFHIFGDGKDTRACERFGCEIDSEIAGQAGQVFAANGDNAHYGVYARRIVGWMLSTSATAGFVLDALEPSDPRSPCV